MNKKVESAILDILKRDFFNLICSTLRKSCMICYTCDLAIITRGEFTTGECYLLVIDQHLGSVFRSILWH
jgi:hypothetical protein